MSQGVHRESEQFTWEGHTQQTQSFNLRSAGFKETNPKPWTMEMTFSLGSGSPFSALLLRGYLLPQPNIFSIFCVLGTGKTKTLGSPGVHIRMSEDPALLSKSMDCYMVVSAVEKNRAKKRDSEKQELQI